jgi:hypothetical protein
MLSIAKLAQVLKKLKILALSMTDVLNNIAENVGC